MILTSSSVLFLLLINNLVSSDNNSNQTTLNTQCLDLVIPNGNVTVDNNDVNSIHIQCHVSYDKLGPDKLQCINGKWIPNFIPQCFARCQPPPFIWNGGFEIGEYPENGLYKQGAVVTYSCRPGFYFTPSSSIFRMCINGSWTGNDSFCEVPSCQQPQPIKNGYYVRENVDESGKIGIGERLHYSCSNGYVLTGPSTQTCLSDRTWSPKIQPICTEDPTLFSCTSAPTVPHGVTKVLSGFELENPTSGTEIEISCLPKYHNLKAPCRANRLKCVRGEWIGILPVCVYSKECPPPPDVRHATPFDINAARFNTKIQRFFENIKISYRCLRGYEIRGNEILTCSSGCWSPEKPPVCHSLEGTYIESNAIGQIVMSMVTGLSVLLLLVVICLVIECRRVKRSARAASIQPSVPRPDLADHAALLHQPDRLALIAFADGLQAGQPVLPTYEEAIRDRVSGCTTTRILRPHWPSLVARRSRNPPNPDSIHVTRQGSFASHSASIRSDPMGSTDTMAVSENSTTVTLDTASSHSGSQPASCRAHCGSLASFDTSSVLNTEGVPLLEENELEEVQCGDDVSLALENRSMTDNVSFKLSNTSDVA